MCPRLATWPWLPQDEREQVTHERSRARGVRRPEERHRRPAALHHDGLLVREPPEAVDAVVVPHAARAHPAERQVELAEVYDYVVDQHATRDRALHDLVDSPTVRV